MGEQLENHGVSDEEEYPPFSNHLGIPDAEWLQMQHRLDLQDMKFVELGIKTPEEAEESRIDRWRLNLVDQPYIIEKYVMSLPPERRKISICGTFLAYLLRCAKVFVEQTECKHYLFQSNWRAYEDLRTPTLKALITHSLRNESIIKSVVTTLKKERKNLSYDDLVVLQDGIEFFALQGGGSNIPQPVTADSSMSSEVNSSDELADLTFSGEIASGASANVWKAREKTLDRDIAVKLLFRSGDFLKRTVEHAKALAKATHPNVVTVIRLAKVRHPSSGEIVEAILMEYLSGKTLAERQFEGKFSKEEVKRIGESIIDGLEHIHSQGLEHGDFHEGNIMISGKVVKILDIAFSENIDLLSTERHEQKIRKDINNLKRILGDLLMNSEVNSELVLTQSRILMDANTIPTVRSAFRTIVIVDEPEATPDVADKERTTSSLTKSVAPRIVGANQVNSPYRTCPKCRTVFEVQQSYLVPQFGGVMTVACPTCNTMIEYRSAFS